MGSLISNTLVQRPGAKGGKLTSDDQTEQSEDGTEHLDDQDFDEQLCERNEREKVSYNS